MRGSFAVAAHRVTVQRQLRPSQTSRDHEAPLQDAPDQVLEDQLAPDHEAPDHGPPAIARETTASCPTQIVT